MGAYFSDKNSQRTRPAKTENLGESRVLGVALHGNTNFTLIRNSAMLFRDLMF